MQRPWTPYELEARKDRKAWNQVLKVDCCLDRCEIPDHQQHFECDALCPLAAQVFKERGFIVNHIYEFVVNDKFYPPFVAKHTKSFLIWAKIHAQTQVQKTEIVEAAKVVEIVAAFLKEA